MENKDKEFIRLKFGLTFKRIIDMNRVATLENKANEIKGRILITSYRKLETASGIRNATILEIISGKKNAASTTIIALLEALDMTLSEFGSLYDNITESEVWEYKKIVERNRKERTRKKQETNSIAYKSKSKK